MKGNKVKLSKKKSSTKNRVVIPRATAPRRQSPAPVTQISTAPVAIGNSVRGARSIVSTTGNGVVVRGRDFMFGATGTGAVNTWTCCGGTPLTPAAFADSVLSNHMRNYSKFRFKQIIAYYITSSPTSSNGDVLFYHGKNRESVFLNQTSSNLLAVVLSDPDTVIGPQWTNHATRLSITGNWKSTDYGMSQDISSYADGELFLLSKTSTTSSPGYVLFDYEIEFAEMQIQPRLLTFPMPRAQFYQTNLIEVASAVVEGVTTTETVRPTVGGNNISGSAASIPTGLTNGDIYKVFFDITNSDASAWTNCTPTNLFRNAIGASGWMTTISDGYTCYAVSYGANDFVLYATVAEAFSGITPIKYGVTANVTFNLQVWMSYVGSISTINMVPNF